MAAETTTDQPTRARSAGRTVRPGVLGLAAVATVCLAPYVAGVLVPYYVNDLDRLSLHELASGAHDPKDLWPQGPGGGLVQVAGYLSLGLAPLGSVVVMIGCLAVAWSSWRRRGVRRRSVPAGACLVALATVCAAAIALFLSPLGAALWTWRVD